MDCTAQLTDFIRQEILHGRDVALDPEEDLLATGVLDSLGLLRMVAFIQERFGLEVPDEDVVFENFSSLAGMAQYVAQREATRLPAAS